MAKPIPDDWTTHDLPFDPGRQEDVARFERREWLLTAGDGSYAMGTALGRNTRRYHGLLVAAARPPVDRVIALSQVLDTLVLSHGPDQHAQRIDFATCGFRDGHGNNVYAPHGYSHLERVQRGLTLTWHYRWGDLCWSRELVLHPATNNESPAVTLRYAVQPFDPSLGSATLELAPMLTLRNFHGLYDGDPITCEASDAHNTITCRGANHAVTVHAPGGTFTPRPDTWHGLHYPVETRRGQPDTEPAHVPGVFEVPVVPGQAITLTATLGESPAEPLAAPRTRADRLEGVRTHLADLPEATALAVAADDFVVTRTAGDQRLATIIAGYPWFSDWGRDAFVALPGLLLCTGRIGDALDVLRCFAGVLRDGVLPNRFDDTNPDAAHYNTIDGSMWFVHAALQTLEVLDRETKPAPVWLVQAIAAVLDAHLQGTHATTHDGRDIPITCDADGLLTAGDDQTQLTWMDAACDVPAQGSNTHDDAQWVPAVFTPRPGKSVEVNALWHSNLAGAAAALNNQKGHKQRAARYATAAKLSGRSFLEVFWDQTHQALLDHVRPDGTPNRQLRPNAVIAASLERTPMSDAQRTAVLDAAEHELLTPSGLRTLAPSEPDFHPHYAGPAWQRDAAYHQGTAWPWLLGPYAEGRARASGFSPAARRQAGDALAPLLRSLTDPEEPNAALGQLHEIHDAQPVPPDAGPAARHAPRGCIAQAWSVAEAIRVSALLAEPH